MSEPESPTSASDRTYRFISDPGHKENLSGRVRAACLTCRKKKIKCSGELNCRTCREKGLVCEGLPERKKPNMRDISPSISSPAPAGIQRKQKISSERKTLLRKQATSSRGIGATTREDSGYASTQPESIESAMSLAEDSNYDDSVQHSQPPQSTGPQPAFRVDSWSLRDPHELEATLRSYDEHTQARIASGTDPASAVIWPPMEGDAPTWQDTSAGNLNPRVAPAPPVHLHSLQHFFANAQNSDPNGVGRRQTIAFPLASPENTPEQRLDLMPSGNTAYDDLALLLAERGLPMGLTPGVNTFPPWWEATHVDFGSLAAAQTVQHDIEQPLAHHSIQDQSEPTRARGHPTSRQTDYFGHLYDGWPHE